VLEAVFKFLTALGVACIVILLGFVAYATYAENQRQQQRGEP
jgi:hypothetical protein